MLDSDRDLMAPGQWDEELAWLKREAAKPHGPWLIAAAHHGLFGNGNHGDNGVLQKEWGPTFKQAGVAMYVNGHEHTFAAPGAAGLAGVVRRRRGRRGQEQPDAA